MSNGKRIAVAFVGSGIIGALTYASSLYYDLSGVFVALVLLVSGTMVKIIGWSPKE